MKPRLTITNASTGNFQQWESVDSDAKCVSATLSRDLHYPLGLFNCGVFESMSDGQTREIDGLEYFREG